MIGCVCRASVQLHVIARKSITNRINVFIWFLSVNFTKVMRFPAVWLAERSIKTGGKSKALLGRGLGDTDSSDDMQDAEWMERESDHSTNKAVRKGTKTLLSWLCHWVCVLKNIKANKCERAAFPEFVWIQTKQRPEGQNGLDLCFCGGPPPAIVLT